MVEDLWPNDGSHVVPNLSIQNLIAYQKRRYARYLEIIKTNHSLRCREYPVVTGGTIKRLNPTQRGVLIGMIEDIRETENYKILSVVDSQGITSVSCEKTLLDSKYLTVGGFIGIVVEAAYKKPTIDSETTVLANIFRYQRAKNRYIAKELLYPGFKDKAKVKSVWNEGIAIISDIHVGAHTHIESDFLNFIEWLNGQRDIKYLLVAGDLVDGRWIFPGQELELKIKEILEQYHALGRALGGLRRDITLVVGMGNHDGMSNRKEVQIWPEDVKNVLTLYKKQIVFVSNPGYFKIRDYYFLMYHGASADPLISRCESLSYEEPTTIGQLLYRYRNLCPCTDKIPILPTTRLYHVVPEEVDYLLLGHVHRRGALVMKDGRQIVCGGTWQYLTPFQEKLGFVPNYCVADIVYPGSPERNTYFSFTSERTDDYKHRGLK